MRAVRQTRVDLSQQFEAERHVLHHLAGEFIVALMTCTG